MLHITELNKSFGPLRALKNVSLKANAGEVLTLIGPNGCGKTTLIKSILGMVVPDSGDILFKNNSIKGSWKYRSQIGYMPQIGTYPENMSIGQVLDMIQDIRSKESHKPLNLDLYESYKLKELLHKRMGTLSGGTRQKVSAHLAFLFDPDVLILDEPTAGLDPLAASILKEKIRKDPSKLILITSHILSDLDDVATHIVYMQEGEIHFKKTIQQIKEETGQSKLSEAVAQIMNEQSHTAVNI